MRDHPAKGSFPVSVYGDEAKYSTQYGDKFIAVALGSPLLWKKGILTYIYILLYIYIHPFPQNFEQERNMMNYFSTVQLTSML
jgi:hypothetical protein